MRRVTIFSTTLLAVLGVTAFAGAAEAQSPGAPSGEARGLRYLSWSGRGPAAAAPAAVASSRPAPARRDLRRPNAVIPHGGSASAEAAPPPRPGLTPAPGARRTLTPANAWVQPRTLSPEPSPPAAPVASAPRVTPDYLPDQGGRGQPVPADIASAPPAPAVTAEPADPMAPRRDAPIFRMRQDAPVQPAPARAGPTVGEPAPAVAGDAPRPGRTAEVVDTDERPPQQSARYYSVHRQNGRRPDALEMPQPTYVDALAVTMIETPASRDLAEPAQGPTLIRDAQGRLRAAPAASDGDHQ